MNVSTKCLVLQLLILRISDAFQSITVFPIHHSTWLRRNNCQTAYESKQSTITPRAETEHRNKTSVSGDVAVNELEDLLKHVASSRRQDVASVFAQAGDWKKLQRDPWDVGEDEILPAGRYTRIKAVQETREKFKRHQNDTGSSEVQIAALTARILHLIQHSVQHKKDFAHRRFIISLVTRRRKLLQYLGRVDFERYQDTINRLNLRPVIIPGSPEAYRRAFRYAAFNKGKRKKRA